MAPGSEIRALDDVAATLRNVADGAIPVDSGVLLAMAEQVQAVADRSQELADIHAALHLMSDLVERLAVADRRQAVIKT